MVSWSDGESSTNGGIDHFDLDEEVPNTIYDPDYCGIAMDSPRLCHHFAKVERFVAFEGTNTGRRFLGYADHEGINCGFVEWVDLEWPDALKKALTELWQLYEESQAGRLRDVHALAEERNKEAEEKRLVVMELNKLQDELKKAVEEKKIAEAERDVAEVSKFNADKRRDEMKKAVEEKKIAEAERDVAEVVKLKAEQERDKMKAEKKQLEYHIADLLKDLDLARGKLRKIRALCDD